MKIYIKVVTVMTFSMLALCCSYAKSNNVEQIEIFKQGKRLLISTETAEKNKGANILYELSKNNPQLSLVIGSSLKKNQGNTLMRLKCISTPYHVVILCAAMN